MRRAAIYRVASPIPPERSFLTETIAELAPLIGTPAGALAREWPRLMERFPRRKFLNLASDPAFAHALAGLSLASGETGPPRPWNDADAAEHRWWVDWKSREGKRATRPSHPFVAPKPLPGSPAPVLREGTLAEAGVEPEVIAKLDAVLEEWAADSDQAFAVCIARRGVIVLHKAYGTRDGEPMTVTTKSWMASITKPMSAMLMMMLVDDGRIALDDRVADILPPLFRMTSTRPITIRHLYTHTHGLDWWMKARDEWPDLEERVADCYPSVRAGRIFNYNGTGYAVAGKVIEAISEESLPDFYHDHLLGPLGMEDTDVSGTYGDARSIPLDIAKFGQMLLNGGTYGDKRFFRASAFHAMLPRLLTSVLGPQTTKIWGIGLNGTTAEFGHGAASCATFRVEMPRQLVIVMTRNAPGTNFDKYNAKFFETLNAVIR